MVIFLYYLNIFGIYLPTMLYPKSCYNEVCCNKFVVCFASLQALLPLSCFLSGMTQNDPQGLTYHYTRTQTLFAGTFGGLVMPSFASGRKVLASLEVSS